MTATPKHLRCEPAPPGTECVRLTRLESSIYAAVLALLVGFSVPWFIWNPMNGDTAFFVYSGSRMLDGATLYRDIVEPNAPPPYLFAVASTALGRLLHLTPETAFVLCVTVLICLSIYRCHRILDRFYPTIPYAAPILTIAIACCLLPYVKDSFGEREHLLCVLILPWLLASTDDLEFRSKRERIADGMMASVGISMKPYFIALYAVVQLVNFVMPRRRFRILQGDSLTIAITQAASALVTLVFFSNYVFMVRMALATYHSFRRDLPSICLHPTFLFFVIMAIICLGNQSRGYFLRLRNGLLMAGVVMMGLLVYQREGFAYHYYPLGVFGWLIATTLMLDRLWTASPLKRRVVALLFVTTVTGVGAYYGMLPLSMPKQTGPLVALVRQEAEGKPILVLSTSLWASSPLINYTHTSSSWRFRSLWTLGGFYSGKPLPGAPRPYRSRADMDEYERYLLESLIEDTRLHPPQLIIVEVAAEKQGFRSGDFDYLDYFLHDDQFAQFFSGYEAFAEVPNYRVYRRRLRARNM
ncbi:MAG: hypothetical protein ABIQ44_02705 [Chloroflexia bacterium]